MRITSLGYNPANQTTNYKNKQHNPAFNGLAEVLVKDLKKVVGPKGQVEMEGFRAVVADLQESLAGLGSAVKPVFEELGQGIKAIMRVPSTVDTEAAKVCGNYKTQRASSNIQGIEINFINR